MSLFRLGLGWAAVTLWYFFFELLEQKIRGSRPETGRLRAGWKVYVADALLLALFAGLWFASLGHGGWVLLFLMVGLLVEGPARVRDGSGSMDLGRAGILRLVVGLIRFVAAGGILALLM